MSIGPIILYVIVFLLLFIAWAILLKELTKPKHLRNQYQTLVANIMVLVAMIILLIGSLIQHFIK
ncbi:hypothetical protein [Staphylococcus carnosus]|uniref:hypothetical protein n=1 Tax=Staphylococcus carnosus TaxID=1281 RepID=UPI0006AB9E2A|nr:hypothetical protein [Staphylococcus carnosus]ANZ34332.1 hypothetical protein BEK99_11430 [Staphylococcus carnosus]KOR11913.1 hypothetical protein AMC75_11940 [Staphylococcus carnosus]QPT03111.1 hypothetical protein I6G40_08315 [Staphylococcus carnosus]UQA68114.1 hypothetical protein Sta3580_04345 [Staphylococcus carnosus]UTB77064.1 hypothetical protein A2I62_00060 [Staphylococcus carnosus]